ncbi:hypothetical protein, partial [Hyphomonas atlantica]|uniref:hypothetical protein n=1 Tax=Hyphomonas atlantica TaxID=1280948 RepID=UPI0019D6F2A3
MQIGIVLCDAPQIFHHGAKTLQVIGALEFHAERVAVAGFASGHDEVSSQRPKPDWPQPSGYP